MLYTNEEAPEYEGIVNWVAWIIHSTFNQPSKDLEALAKSPPKIIWI